MRLRTLVASVLCSAATLAAAQNISLYIGEPRANIGVHFTSYPEFVRVPNYPVYYVPRARYNVFFYDGLYWAYYDDRWYASSWYNGPWAIVEPEAVPVYVLRVPVRYYRQPPAYFASWAQDAPPRWDVHYGSSWAQKRAGWDSWNRSSVPAPAPLPVYQRQYVGTRYPSSVEQQVVIQGQQYRYQPRETVVQQYYNRQGVLTTKTTTTTASAAATSVAPGQLKRQQGAQSAKEFAPGQVKKQEGAQSAKAYAPGQVKKQQVAQAPAPVVVQQQPGRGQRDRDGDGDIDANDRGQGHGQGHGQGQGQGKGKGKGHGKD
jgi:hypothetical protein